MDEGFKKQLGKKIKQLRTRLNLTQEEFCSKILIEVPTLSNIENGKSYPTFVTLKNIIDAFGIEPNEVFEFEHLLDENNIDKKLAEKISNLSLSKKQCLYRIINLLDEIV